MTGAASLLLWAFCFLLMLRTRALERLAGGLDRLYWVHHVCGALAYVALLMHPLALALPSALVGDWRAAAARLDPFAPGLPTAAGWGALVLLSSMMLLTFGPALAYRRWRALHRVVVPAFALAVVHVGWLTGNAVRWMLTALSLIVVAALAGHFALRRGWIGAHPFRVAAIDHPGTDLVDLRLVPEGRPVSWSPGQFVFAAFLDGPGWHGCGEAHPYTIAGGDGGALRLLIRSQGRCTCRLQSVPVGTRVRVEGPHGAFLFRRDPARPQLWIAGGIGLTPFLAATDALQSSPGTARDSPGGQASENVPIDLVHIHRPDDPPAGRLLARPMQAGGPRVHAIASQREGPEVLWARIVERVGPVAGRQVFVCGPAPLVGALRGSLLRAGATSSDIHTERFDFR